MFGSGNEPQSINDERMSIPEFSYGEYRDKKFIRNKDYIKRLLSQFTNQAGEVVYIAQNFPENDYIRESAEVKIRNNVEELCDVFVVEFEESEDRITYLNLDWAIDKASRYPGHTKIKGAIWTSWGLKYIAELDKHKDLILLNEVK